MIKNIFKTIVYIVFLMLCRGSFALEEPVDDNSYQGVEFRRWSPVVSNMDETIHLYVDILGLELNSLTVDPKTSYVYEVFAIDKGVTTRHATFNSGQQERVLSVVEVPGATVPVTEPRMSVVLLNANGRFDQIVSQLKEGGYQVLAPHKLGRQGIEIGFIDRDGHLYALYEFPYLGRDYDLDKI